MSDNENADINFTSLFRHLDLMVQTKIVMNQYAKGFNELHSVYFFSSSLNIFFIEKAFVMSHLLCVQSVMLP